MGTLAPLRVRPFARLLTAYTVNEIGDSFAIVALAILVYDETGSAAATSALFLLGKFGPAFIAPMLTARIDQQSLRRSIPLIYFGEAIVFVGLALLADDFMLAFVLVLALVDGTLALSGRSILRGGIAKVLAPAGLLREGNALTNLGFAAAAIGGSLLAGVIVEASGVATALLIDAASFALAGLLILTAGRLPAGAEVRTGFRARLTEGFSYVRRTPRLGVVMTGEALALVFFTLAVPIEIVYAKETLETGNDGFGLLMASWGAGLVLGSSLYVVVRRRSTTMLVLLSTAAVGIAYLGWSIVDELAIACVFAVLGGTGNGIQWVSVMTLLQESIPADLQARVVGLLESIGAAAPGLGFLAGGAITSLSSAPTALAIAGSGILVLVGVGALMRTRLSLGVAMPQHDPGR